MLERLHQVFTWLRLKSSVLRLADNFSHLPLVEVNLFLDLLYDIWFGDNVCYADGKTCVYQPIIDDELDVRENICTGCRSKIFPNDMDETTC